MLNKHSLIWNDSCASWWCYYAPQYSSWSAPGTSMMMIVPLNELYVALKKVSWKKSVRVNQWHWFIRWWRWIPRQSGRLLWCSAFALIPAQNATGNWIKDAYRFVLHLTRKNLLNTHWLVDGSKSRLICEVNAYETPFAELSGGRLLLAAFVSRTLWLYLIRPLPTSLYHR